jgi:hypothetical protein
MSYYSLISLMPKFSFDPDAQAFITAAAITDNTQKNAINTLVLDLKSYSIWTKMKAIYPVVGGTASTHKFNLKDPRDLDVAFRLTFFGGVTHSNNGIQGNGTNGYGDTFFNPTTQGINIDNFGLTVVSRTDQARSESDIGSRDSNFVGVSQMLIRSALNVSQHQINSTATGTITEVGITTSLGFFSQNRTNGTQLKINRNGVVATFAQNSSTVTDRKIAIMALLTNATYGSFSSKQYSSMAIHEGLSDVEVENFRTAITNFNTSLSR